MSEEKQENTPIRKGNHIHLRMQSATVRKTGLAQPTLAEFDSIDSDVDDSKSPQYKRKRIRPWLLANPFTWFWNLHLRRIPFRLKTSDRQRKTFAKFLLIAICLCIALQQFLGKLSGRTNKDLVLRLSPPKPRMIGLYKSPTGERVSLDFEAVAIPTTRSEKRIRRQATDWYFQTGGNEESQDHRPDQFEDGDCKAMYEWQKQSFPNCNLIHEHHIRPDDVATMTVDKINYGFFRDVWRVRKDFNETDPTKYGNVVLKTLRMEQPFDGYNADRHRRDAVAMERLTSSPHVVNIYGYCVNSQLTEYSDGGDVYDAVFTEKISSSITKLDRLRIAEQIAAGVAEVHNLEKEGQAPMAHTDITPPQFILIGGFYKLNDFNRVRFIRWNEKTNEPCPYKVANNPGEVSVGMIRFFLEEATFNSISQPSDKSHVLHLHRPSSALLKSMNTQIRRKR